MSQLTHQTPRTTKPATILVVDDESSLRDTIAYSLRRDGFVVETAAEGSRAIQIARERQPDLIVLDIMLPGLDGLHVCRVIRRESNVPIIMLSAKGEEVDRVLGLEMGADDYLTKPFAMRELVARIKAQLRRSQMDSPSMTSLPESDLPVVEIGDLRIDQPGRRVSIAGNDIALKPKEYELLAYLAINRDRVVGREQILRDVWGYEVPIDTRTIDVHIRWLRQKLGQNAAIVPDIETLRGVGYRLSLNPRDHPGATK